MNEELDREPRDFEDDDRHLVEPVCVNCDHPISRHGDTYGCQYERGDRWVDGPIMGGYVAQGPCGCTKPEPELNCSNCGSYCVEVENKQYFSGVWSAGVAEMLTATIVTCSACGQVEEI